MTGLDDLIALQDTLYESKNPTRRWLHRKRRDWVMSALQRYAKTSSRRAAEIGPGAGVYLPLLSDLFDELFVVDVELAYLERARLIAKGRSNIYVQEDDITESSLSTGTFDLILCTEVLEHLENSPAALGEMHRLLRPGGVLIATTPQRWSTVEIIAKLALAPGAIRLTRAIYGEPVLPTGHINLLSGKEARQQILAAGYEIVERSLFGLYLPVLAELCGDTAVKLETFLEHKIKNGPLKALLWTQGYVLRAN